MREGIRDGSYISGVKWEDKAVTDVGVYFCGPNTAARDIKKATREATGEDVGEMLA